MKQNARHNKSFEAVAYGKAYGEIVKVEKFNNDKSAERWARQRLDDRRVMCVDVWFGNNMLFRIEEE